MKLRCLFFLIAANVCVHVCILRLATVFGLQNIDVRHFVSFSLFIIFKKNMEKVIIKPHQLDSYKVKSYQGFSVRNGKAIYHYLTIANNSCGLYYGINEDTGAKRQIEPTDDLIFRFSD